jgi:hypothetical protein
LNFQTFFCIKFVLLVFIYFGRVRIFRIQNGGQNRIIRFLPKKSISTNTPIFLPIHNVYINGKSENEA